MKRFFVLFLKAVSKLIPIKRNRILFTSLNGQYCDSPKYISEKMHELDREMEIVWLVKKDQLSLVPDYAKTVDVADSLRNLYYRASSRAIVDNVYGGKETRLAKDNLISKARFLFSSWLKKRKNQMVFTTWHGTPLKKMGQDHVGNVVLDFNCPNTIMFLDNQYTVGIMKRLTFGKVKMELLGAPRNDQLFMEQDKIQSIRQKIGLPEGKRIVLYAPTFRNDGPDVQGKNVQRSGIEQIKEIDFESLFETLSQKFGGDWIFVCRFHYHVEAMVKWDELEKQYPGRIINGNLHKEMSDYLACADILVTDASSCMFDFAASKRPCFLFFPDFENYRNNERGVYYPVEKLPYPLAVNFEELVLKIKNFDCDEFCNNIDFMLKEFGYIETRNASQNIAKYILEKVK